VRLPVVKILWGMFAFPAMYPGAFFAAAGKPLLGMIALILLWSSGSISADDQVLTLSIVILNYALFAWLAVRCHRLILADDASPGAPPVRMVKLTLNYLAALATGAVFKTVLLMILVSVALVAVGARFVPSPGGVPPDGHPPATDPAVQRVIDYGLYVFQVPILYLLARFSSLLPALALGHAWAPGSAWRHTRGNGWRLVVVVFLLPWLLESSVAWVNRSTPSPILTGLLAVVAAVFMALGVIALSLSYRELPPWPAPPPTAPPA